MIQKKIDYVGVVTLFRGKVFEKEMVISSRAQVKGLAFDGSWDIVHCKRMKERT